MAYAKPMKKSPLAEALGKIQPKDPQKKLENTLASKFKMPKRKVK